MTLIRTLALCWLCLASPVLAYENPIITGIMDPDTYEEGGTYHMITSAGGPKNAHYAYRTSRDLLHWSAPVAILPQPKGINLWQGSFFRDGDGQLYLYYTTVDRSKAKAVHVARAEDFTGPFTDLGVVAPHAIDPYPLRAEDGSLWLYFKDTRPGEKSIWVQPMASPARAAGAASEVLSPRPGTFEDNGFLSVEGPSVIARGGHYFLLYTGGPFGQKTYSVGYAVADRPQGPFTRGPNNPLLSNSLTPNVYSPGVPAVVTDGAGKSWLVYRQRVSARRSSEIFLAIDPLDDAQAAKGILRASPSRDAERPDPVPLR